MVSCSHCGVRNKKCVSVSREHYEKATHRGTSPSRPQLCHKCIKALNITVLPEQIKYIHHFDRESIKKCAPQKSPPTQSHCSNSSTNVGLSSTSFSLKHQGPRSSPPSENSQGQNPDAAQLSSLTPLFNTTALLSKAAARSEESGAQQETRQMTADDGVITNSPLQELDPLSHLMSDNLSPEFVSQPSSNKNPPLLLIPLLFSEIKNIIALPVTRLESSESDRISISIIAEKTELGYKVLSSSCIFSPQALVPPAVESPEFPSNNNRVLPHTHNISIDSPLIRVETSPHVNSANTTSTSHCSDSTTILHLGEENAAHSETDYTCLLGRQPGNDILPNNYASELHSTTSNKMQSIPSLTESSLAISEGEYPETVNSTDLPNESALPSSFPNAEEIPSILMSESDSNGTSVPRPPVLSSATISTALTISTSEHNIHSLTITHSQEPQSSDLGRVPFSYEAELESRDTPQNTIRNISKGGGGCTLTLREVIHLPYDNPGIFQFQPFPQNPNVPCDESATQSFTTKSTQTQFPYSPKKVRFIRFSESSDKSTQTDFLQEQDQEHSSLRIPSIILNPQIIRISEPATYVPFQLRPIQKSSFSQTPKSLVRSMYSEFSKPSPQSDSDQLLSKFNFGADQLLALKNPSGFARWQPTTIFTALQLRLLSSPQSYNFIRTVLHYPLPGIRTLQRKQQNFLFTPGFQKEVVDTISLSLANSHVLHKDCVLTYDEIKIKAALKFCPSLKRILGIPTLKSSKPDDVATHLFVVMARGLHSSWKSIVGWHFTSPHTLSEELSNFVLLTISNLEAAGLHVMAITSDTGGNNRKIMTKLGIFCKLLRNTRIDERTFESPFDLPNIRIRYSFPNPADEKRKIYFFPDPPHVLKNIRNQLLKQDFFIQPEILQEWGITSHPEFVSFDYIRKLYGLQRDNKFRMAFKLSASHINPDSYSKMRVGLAFDIFSRPVQAGIKSLIETNSETEHGLATVKFLSIVEKWFALSTARHTSVALHKTNEKTNQSFDELKSTMKVFANMVAVDQGSHAKGWKPIQSSLLIATHSLISLTKDLFERGYDYVLTGRFSQDPVESLFGVIRSRTGPHPTAPQISYALKAVVAANLTKPENTTLTPDENPLFRPRKKAGIIVPNLVFSTESSLAPSARIPLKLSAIEELAFFDFCGAVARKVLSNSMIGAIIGEESSMLLCANCTDILDIKNCTEKPSIYTRNLSRGYRLTVNDEVFSLLSKAERVVRMQMPALISDPSILQHLEEKLLSEFSSSSELSCCDLREKLLKVFVRYSLSVELSFINKGIVSQQHAVLNFSEIPDADCPIAQAAARNYTESESHKIRRILVHPLALENLSNDKLQKEPTETIHILPREGDQRFHQNENPLNVNMETASHLQQSDQIQSTVPLAKSSDCSIAQAATLTYSESESHSIRQILVHPLALLDISNETIQKQPTETIQLLLSRDQFFHPNENLLNPNLENASPLPESDQMHSTIHVAKSSEKVPRKRRKLDIPSNI